MAKHLIKGHIYWQHNKYLKEPKITFSEYDKRQWEADSRDGCVWVAEHSFTVEVADDFDPRPQMIAALQAEKQSVRAAFAAKVKEIDDRIASLLAIENAA